MKTDKYLPTEDKRANEETFAKRLNAAKHRNPQAVVTTLNIPTALIGDRVVVNWQSGAYWAGSVTQEYCCKLGATYDDADATLRAKSL